jgi:hypothetical protein
MSRGRYRCLVRTEQPSTHAADTDGRPFVRHLETDAVSCEWAAVESCALPLAWDPGEDIVDPDQQPEVTSRGTLIAKAVASVVFPELDPPLRITTLDLVGMSA